MSIFKTALNQSLGLEDEAPTVEINIDTDETGMPIDNVTDEGENTPEADEVEIIEDSEEISADNEVIEEMSEATDSLESIYLAMESAQANGGLTPEAAAFAAIGVDSIVRKYNATSEALGISLESFGDNRVQATTVSMEGVGQAIKDLWDTIVKKFQAMIKKIADFYQKTIAAAPRIKRRAEALRKKARAEKGAPKAKTMKTGLYGSLNIAGSVPSATQLQSAIKVLHTDITTNASKTDITSKAASIFGSFVGAGVGSAGVANKMATELKFTGVSGNKLTGSSKGSVKVANSQSDVALELNRDLPGNKMFFKGTVAGTPRSSAIDALRDFRIGIYTDNDSVKTDKTAIRDKEWAVLSTAEIETLCDGVIKNMEAIISQKTQADKKVNDVKIIKKEGDKLIAKIDGADKAKSQAEASKALNITIDVMRQQNQGEAQVLSYSYRTSKAILAYCARSLSQYKSK